MDFFRNPEVKTHLAVFLLTTLAAGAAGLLVSARTALALWGLGLVLTGVSLYLLYRRQKSVRRLGAELDRILHGEERLELGSYREGDVSVLRDEIYKMTIRLREQAESLEREKHGLSSALADISHQIRTPLTSVSLMAERLRGAGLDDAQRKRLLREMNQMLDRIRWLVDTLLKMSRLEAGSIQMDIQEISMEPFLEEAVKPFFVPMEIREQTLLVENPGTAAFSGDFSWTAEALGNVLKNCMEYTPRGGTIVIGCRETPLFTEISVRDSGPGIAPEDMPHVFERFYKGKAASKDSFGIGLSLARAILQRENAVIKAENAPGGGSRFLMRFYKTAV